MKVVAKQLGYYDLKRRFPGDTFTLSNKKEFSENWMTSLEKNDEAPEVKAPASRSPNKFNGKGSKEGKPSVEKAKHEEKSLSDAEVI